jgi:hypothetical protein
MRQGSWVDPLFRCWCTRRTWSLRRYSRGAYLACTWKEAGNY